MAISTYCIVQNFGRLMDTCFSNTYLTENFLTDGHYLLPWTCKYCNALKIDRLSFDDLAGKHEKHQNFPCQNFALYGTCLLHTQNSDF